MCGPFLFGSFWWIVPLVGMLMCLGFLIIASRFSTVVHGGMCMGGHRGTRNNAVAETRG